jgi:SpoVK/Ycf46/Vps4 family AAA+-type ATPase
MKKSSKDTKKRKRQLLIEGVSDLIELCDTENNTKDIKNLKKIYKSLVKLDQMIGMDNVKKNIIYQILYFLQNLNKKGDMLHTVITGPPGVGKTEISKIIAEIYSELGILELGQVVFAKRSDLIGEYLGQTAIKTQEVLESARGGVLVIDECYSLGHPDKRDSYSKECIDTLNQFLTEEKEHFACIICGYKDALETNFFSQNQGLQRRFPWRYDIQEYNNFELLRIFKKQVYEQKWKLDKNAITPLFFKENKDLFPNFGGSTEIFLTKCKMAHSKRIFEILTGKKNKKLILNTDIINGLELYKPCLNLEQTNEVPANMYS